MRFWRACSRPSRRAWRIASPRPSCSSSGVTYPIDRVQPHSVVLGPYPVEFKFEFAGVADLLQVWPLTLHVPEQGLDPGLVGRRRRAPELLRDGQRGHELTGAVRAHLRAVVADREQQRHLPGDGELGQAVVVASVSAACSSGLAQDSAASDMPSASSAAVNATSTWVEDSSAATRVVSHLRDTMSRIAIAARRARVKWVKS